MFDLSIFIHRPRINYSKYLLFVQIALDNTAFSFLILLNNTFNELANVTILLFMPTFETHETLVLSVFCQKHGESVLVFFHSWR